MSLITLKVINNSGEEITLLTKGVAYADNQSRDFYIGDRCRVSSSNRTGTILRRSDSPNSVIQTDDVDIQFDDGHIEAINLVYLYH
ncbi:MAG: hypothetical protein V7L21_10085 [Nostoc sp.]|uniref:hypothetical protein n=1 Tax=Nostoc sp. TaxID=1180 RepID=UPI002FFC54D0